MELLRLIKNGVESDDFYEQMNVLLVNGANQKCYVRALHCACRRGMLQAVQMLVLAGAKSKGAFKIASNSGNIEMVKILLNMDVELDDSCFTDYGTNEQIHWLLCEESARREGGYFSDVPEVPDVPVVLRRSERFRSHRFSPY